MALIECSQCGHRVSSMAVRCPKCGAILNAPRPTSTPAAAPATQEQQQNTKPQEEQNTPAAAPTTQEQQPQDTPQQEQEQDEDSEEPDKDSGNTSTVWIAAGITIAVIVGVSFIFCIPRPTPSQAPPMMPVDTTEVDTTVQDTVAPLEGVTYETPETEPTAEEVTDDNDYDTYDSEPQERGFTCDNDVREFVCGTSYGYGSVSLIITDEAIYANGNVIATSPRFRRLSADRGSIRAGRISIIVRRNDNSLVDGKNGDVYRHDYYRE